MRAPAIIPRLQCRHCRRRGEMRELTLPGKPQRIRCDNCGSEMGPVKP